MEVPKGWEYHRVAPQDYKFNMRIALKQDRFDDLVTSLYEVSDPYHPKYVFLSPNPGNVLTYHLLIGMDNTFPKRKLRRWLHPIPILWTLSSPG